MLSQDDKAYSSTGPIEHPSRPANHRALLNERRHAILQQKHIDRHTDHLPKVIGNASSGKSPSHALAQLREENKRLRWAFEQQRVELEQLIADYNGVHEQFDREIEAIHKSHELEIEQFQTHMREMMEERNQMQDIYQDLQRRYQELYHSYQEAVEEEASKMVTDAARTLVLSPEHVPPLLHDVKKTVEFQIKQEEDQHIAEALYMMRQAQIKAEQLEQELAREREQIDAERRNIVKQQMSIREQATLRYQTLHKRLKARTTIAITMITTILLLLLPLLQFLFLSVLKVSFSTPLLFSLLAPIIVCVAVASYLSHLRFISHTHQLKMSQIKNSKGGATAKKAS